LRSLADALRWAVQDLTEELIGRHHHDWSADPYSHSAHSHVRAGGLRAHATLAAPLERPVFRWRGHGG